MTSNAVISVTKAVSANSGSAGSGPYTYTLTYTNTGNAAGTALTITDVVPTGLTYASGSARWSVTGSTVLTDASNSDDQSGIVYDFGITTAGRVTAVIASVSPGGNSPRSSAVQYASASAALRQRSPARPSSVTAVQPTAPAPSPRYHSPRQ